MTSPQPATSRVSANGTPRAKRSRRSQEELIAVILEVAAHQFATRGLSGTRVLDVAEQAKVSTATLYAHFRSKDELFAVASLEPFMVFAREMGNLWDDQALENTDDYSITATYINTLYRHMKGHAASIRAVFLASRDPQASGVTKLAHREFSKVMRKLEAIGVHWAELRKMNMPDAGLRVRTTVSVVVSAAILGDWFYGPMNRAKEEEVLATITDVIYRANTMPR